MVGIYPNEIMYFTVGVNRLSINILQGSFFLVKLISVVTFNEHKSENIIIRSCEMLQGYTGVNFRFPSSTEAVVWRKFPLYVNWFQLFLHQEAITVRDCLQILRDSLPYLEQINVQICNLFETSDVDMTFYSTAYPLPNNPV